MCDGFFFVDVSSTYGALLMGRLDEEHYRQNERRKRIPRWAPSDHIAHITRIARIARITRITRIARIAIWRRSRLSIGQRAETESTPTTGDACRR